MARNLSICYFIVVCVLLYNWFLEVDMLKHSLVSEAWNHDNFTRLDSLMESLRTSVPSLYIGRESWRLNIWNWLICCCLVTQLCPTLYNPMDCSKQASQSFTICQSLFKLMSIESVMPTMRSNNLILCHPLLFLPLVFLSIRAFSSETALPIRWPKYWSFSVSISLISWWVLVLPSLTCHTLIVVSHIFRQPWVVCSRNSQEVSLLEWTKRKG